MFCVRDFVAAAERTGCNFVAAGGICTWGGAVRVRGVGQDGALSIGGDSLACGHELFALRDLYVRGLHDCSDHGEHDVSGAGAKKAGGIDVCDGGSEVGHGGCERAASRERNEDRTSGEHCFHAGADCDGSRIVDSFPVAREAAN